MIAHTITEQNSYGETGLATQVVKTTSTEIQDEDMTKLCETGFKIISILALVVLGIVLRECPSPTWLLGP
jgi:hypothetical protein